MVTYPKDWTPMQLKDLGYIQMCRRIFQSQTKEYGAIPFYKISTFGGKADAYISQELYEQYKSLYPYPENGDILISAAGTVGKTVVFDGRDSYFQDSNIVWLKVDKNAIDRKFLWWFYRSYPWEALEGTTIQRLYNSIILKTEIHLPDKPEQEEIARTLSQFDAYIDDLAELIEKKKGIRDGALEELVRGTFTVDGQDLIWNETELNEVAFYRKGRTTSERSKYISTENMNQNFTGIEPYNGSEAITGCQFEKTDTLVANIRPYLKKIWFANFSGCCSADVLVIRAKEGMDSRLLYYFLANERFVNYVMSGGVKGIKMPRGDKEYIMHYPVRVPVDKSEQAIIANSLAAMDEEIEALEIERDKMIQIREGAMDDLLTGRVRLSV